MQKNEQCYICTLWLHNAECRVFVRFLNLTHVTKFQLGSKMIYRPPAAAPTFRMNRQCSQFIAVPDTYFVSSLVPTTAYGAM